MTETSVRSYLVDCMSAGKEASFDDTLVDAGVIRSLLIGRSDRIARANSALRIRGARVRGPLDLSWCGSAHEPLPALSMTRCQFDPDSAAPSVDVSNAHIGGLELSDSRLTCLRGIDVRVSGSVNISGIRPVRDDCDAFCWCNLSRSVIDGHVLADDVVLRAPRPRRRSTRVELDAAFNLYMSRLAGSMMIGARKNGEGATVDGGILLDSAHVGSDVRIDGATLLPFDEHLFFALALERVRVDGSVTLARTENNKPVVCRGRLWMYRATIGGSFDVMGTTFEKSGEARRCLLFAEDVSVRGQVWLENVTASGPVNLRRIQSESVIYVRNVQCDADIDFGGARCAVLDVERSARSGAILNDGLTFDRIEGDWLREETHLDEWLRSTGTAYRPQPYTQLAQVLSSEGREGQARDVLLKKAWRDASRTWYDRQVTAPAKSSATDYLRLAGRRCVWPFILFYGVLFRFGLSPIRATATLVGSIVIGIAMFGWIDSRHALVVSQTPVAGYAADVGIAALTVQDNSPTNIPCGDRIRLPVYAVDIFIPLIDLREEGKCEIDAARPPPGAVWKLPGPREVTFYRWLKAGYAVSGWIVTTLALLTFSGIMRHRLSKE